MKIDVQDPTCLGDEDQNSVASLTDKLSAIPQLSTLVHGLNRKSTILGVVAVVAGVVCPDQGIIFHPG